MYSSLLQLPPTLCSLSSAKVPRFDRFREEVDEDFRESLDVVRLGCNTLSPEILVKSMLLLYNTALPIIIQFDRFAIRRVSHLARSVSGIQQDPVRSGVVAKGS